MKTHPNVSFKIHWVRETFGFEQKEQSGGVVLEPSRGKMKSTQPGADRLTSVEHNVRMALGDDMDVVFDPEARTPIVIFDRQGRIVRKLVPRGDQTTRDLLIELLNH